MGDIGLPAGGRKYHGEVIIIILVAQIMACETNHISVVDSSKALAKNIAASAIRYWLRVTLSTVR